MAKDFVYSDLDKDLTIERDGNIKINYDEDVIRQSIKTIMAVASGERVRSSFGGSLVPLLFRPIDEYLEDDIARELNRVITQNESRVNIRSIIVRADRDRNSIDVEILVNIKKINKASRFRTSLRSFAS